MIGFAVAIAMLVGLFAWLLVRIRKEYRSTEALSTLSVAGVSALYVLHLATTAAAAVTAVWGMPMSPVVSLGGGCLLLGMGATLYGWGIWSFRSFERTVGLDTATLVTSGIYRWSRNPQNVGWTLVLLGIALLGESGLAFALTVLFWAHFVIYVRLEEQFLGASFGDKYREYMSWSHRYFGPPRR